VGIAFGEVADHELDSEVLPQLLESEDKALSQFAAGFIRGRFFPDNNWEWVDSIITSDWSASQIGKFFSFLPFVNEVWERVSRKLEGDESFYWLNANVNPYIIENIEHYEYAVKQLLKHGRPKLTIPCLATMLQKKQHLNRELTIKALHDAADSDEPYGNMYIYDVLGLIKALQDTSEPYAEDIVEIEAKHMNILNQDHDKEAYPKHLELQLANEPEFYCEIIQYIFKSSKRPEDKEATDEDKIVAGNLYTLLDGWRTPPGTKADGSFDEDLFEEWLNNVKEICSKTGHLTIALQIIGQVLIYAPPDPSGLWINETIASALNASDAGEMRKGYYIGKRNSRGMYTLTAGKKEQEIANKYRNTAGEVEAHGYHRFANMLRELASDYERDGERDAARDRLSGF
jgi:hypothetical protein